VLTLDGRQHHRPDGHRRDDCTEHGDPAGVAPDAVIGHMGIAHRGQWKKCRSPVRYRVTPAFAHASMTSASRTEPPGCTIARMPASMRICGPSAKGKKA